MIEMTKKIPRSRALAMFQAAQGQDARQSHLQRDVQQVGRTLPRKAGAMAHFPQFTEPFLTKSRDHHPLTSQTDTFQLVSFPPAVAGLAGWTAGHTSHLIPKQNAPSFYSEQLQELAHVIPGWFVSSPMNCNLSHVHGARGTPGEKSSHDSRVCAISCISSCTSRSSFCAWHAPYFVRVQRRTRRWMP